MKVLLTDGSGATARQVANRLFAAGHVVDVLSPDPLCLSRFTRHVRRVLPVPKFGLAPLQWLYAALEHYRVGGYDVLFPTQEQVAVLAAAPDRLRSAGVVTAVPSFPALTAVQDKLSAFATLTRLGIPQPPTAVGIDGWTDFPAYVKVPIGTASGGVWRVESLDEINRLALDGTVLIQAATEGPLVMCSSVFDRGTLVAFHSCERMGEGARGGASHKRSLNLPELRTMFETIGCDLGWNGALSADVILGETGPVFIDVNPRLVEPENAWRSGVDLVTAMLDVALHNATPPQASGLNGVRTHQLLLAILGTAQHGRGRRGVAREILAAIRNSGFYEKSAEELTPANHDLRALVPLIAAAVATLVIPTSWSWFASGSVDNYALSPNGWKQILASTP